MATPIPENRAQFSFAELCAALGDDVVSGVPRTDVCGVTTNSRGDLSGKLFVALRGERFDGHEFVARAIEAGAAACLVEGEVDAPSSAVLWRVPSTLTALGDLARFHRRRWGKTVVAIIGSAGKTTTRSALTALAESRFPGQVCSTLGNLNNRVGVPMMLFVLGDQHEIGIFELGTNQRGEIAELGRISEPNVALLTLIDLEHTEGLGDLTSVAEEEGDLFEVASLRQLIALNADDALVQAQANRGHAPRLHFGLGDSADYRAISWEPLGLERSRVTARRPRGDAVEQFEFETTLIGEPGVRACLGAVAVVDHLAGTPLSGADITKAFGGMVGEPGRLRPVQLADGTILLDDSYNANPASMRAAIVTAQKIAASHSRPLVLVLGEMRELGAYSDREHRALGKLVAETNPRATIAVGREAVPLFEAAKHAGAEVYRVASAEQASGLCAELLSPGDVVLVKGSRGIHLERVVQALSHLEQASELADGKKGTSA
jgi:UDP-N-acetylmuramoyl-tripeptide--D-alanyl-D-alanine ligase